MSTPNPDLGKTVTDSLAAIFGEERAREIWGTGVETQSDDKDSDGTPETTPRDVAVSAVVLAGTVAQTLVTGWTARRALTLVLGRKISYRDSLRVIALVRVLHVFATGADPMDSPAMRSRKVWAEKVVDLAVSARALRRLRKLAK